MKAGVWLKREYLQGGIIDKQVACSECDYTTGHAMTNWYFCPVCGARLFLTVTELKDWMKQTGYTEELKAFCSQYEGG